MVQRIIPEGLRIQMLVHNGVLRDARVLKEATTLAEAGHQVKIIGISDGPEIENHVVFDGRVPVRLLSRTIKRKEIAVTDKEPRLVSESIGGRQIWCRDSCRAGASSRPSKWTSFGYRLPGRYFVDHWNCILELTSTYRHNRIFTIYIAFGRTGS